LLKACKEEKPAIRAKATRRGQTMRHVDRRIKVGRRNFLRGTAAAFPAAALAASGMGISATAAWAQAAHNLTPHTMATLVRMARDIYPHDRVPDIFYIKAVLPFDLAAEQDGMLRDMLEAGVAQLDADARARYGGSYLGIAEESIRVGLLQGISSSPFFEKIRSDLIVTFYNQHELWPLFGYEGSSFEYGGYLHRGFNDIDWLPNS
jgi:hypothetical protein